MVVTTHDIRNDIFKAVQPVGRSVLIGMMIAFSFCLGFASQKILKNPDRFWQPTTKILVNILFPCLIFSSIPTHYTKAKLIFESPLILSTFSISMVGFILAPFYQRISKSSDPNRLNTIGAISVSGNYVFLPLPLALWLWGEEASTKVLLSSIGSDLGLWLLAASFFAQKPMDRIKHLISPPLISLTITLLLVWHDLRIFEPIIQFCRFLGWFVIPIALGILGFRMAQVKINSNSLKAHLPLILHRLILVPAIVVSLAMILGLNRDLLKVVVLIASMPTAIASVFLSQMYKADSAFAAESVLVTHCCALFTVPSWLVFQAFFLYP